MANTLPVSYVPQLGVLADEHGNDCGAASLLMVARSYNLALTDTVDQVYNSLSPTGDTSLSFTLLQFKLSSYGIKTERKNSTTIELLFGYLRMKKPVLTLIHYAPLVDAGLTEKKGFRGAHFIVVTGIDLDYVFINDPYRTDNVINIAIPANIFEKAWKECYIDDNPIGACIVPVLPIQDLAVPVPPTVGNYTLIPLAAYIRKGPGTAYAILKTIYRTPTLVISVDTATLTNGYVQLTDKSGWIWFEYLKKI